jgi:AcrR family transcriptional regulator
MICFSLVERISHPFGYSIRSDGASGYDGVMETLRRDAARTRERIVDAARTLAAEGQIPGLNAVARAADVGVGTVYRHFATIPELEEALVWRQFDALAEILRSAGPDELEHVLVAYFELLVGDPLFEKVTSRGTPASDRTSELKASLLESLEELITRAAASGHLRPDVTASVVVVLLCGVAHSSRAAGSAADGIQGRFLLRIMLDGLAASGSASGR